MDAPNADIDPRIPKKITHLAQPGFRLEYGISSVRLDMTRENGGCNEQACFGC